MFTKNRLILILGLWIVFIALYGGFPPPYDTVIYVISGLAISTLSFMLARHKRTVHRSVTRKTRQNEVYLESVPAVFVEEQKEEIEAREEIMQP
ncbi:hypothetical protein EXS61_00685 [Candidatus Parcubacteria bacterium]|nr:hypothetical protein [Candidatus Parcubacteria bacterium]